MHLPSIEVHECTTLEEATGLMDRHAPNARFLAGGTDVLVDLKTGRYKIGHLISINRIAALRGITMTADGLNIGALTPITEVNRSELVQQHAPAILDASREMAAQQIRNMATVGGNICCAAPCADLPPILMALNASIELVSPQGKRCVALDSFFVSYRQTAIGSSELLSAVVVPNCRPRFGAAYARFGLREGNSIAVAGVAASLGFNHDGTIADARIVLGSVAPTPKSADAAAAALVGKLPLPEIFEEAAKLAREAAEPISDVRGSAEYRRELVGVLTGRALQTAAERAGAEKS